MPLKEFARGKHLTSPTLNEIIEYLDKMKMPTVALINGQALGGGESGNILMKRCDMIWSISYLDWKLVTYFVVRV